MSVRLHKGDLPDLSRYSGRQVAIDTETMGLNPARDRLCVVQLSPGDGTADVVQIQPGQTDAPNLKALLADETKTKLFHFARFDMAALQAAFGIMPSSAMASAAWASISNQMRKRVSGDQIAVISGRE